jgi:hypothetical protein
MDLQGAVSPIGRNDKAKAPSQLLIGKPSLLILRGQTRARRQNPYLKQVENFLLRSIEFTVANARARTHSLNHPRLDETGMPHVILMAQGALQNIRQDLHILVGMFFKPTPGLNAIFIDDPKTPESHMFGIQITPKRKGMVRFQPIIAKVPPLVRPTNRYHRP